ncbi:MAG: hypothetical protein IKS41_02755 [Alphaproteobacteria bacterium]|nr:hypothetical protein [Alphaproteobacteria bacterium]
MALTTKDKKRIAAYSVGAAASCIRNGLKLTAFVAKCGISMGEIMGTFIMGSALSLADQITGSHSGPNIGDSMSRGLANSLRSAADWTSNIGCRGVTSLELMAKRKIVTGRW